MSNHEKKDYAKAVDVLLAFQRPKDNQEHRTMRQVVKDYDIDLAMLEYRCKLQGGTWRIHKTVNLRDTEKARLWLIHKLIDFPEGAGFIDSLWRTALLQPENIYGQKMFMFDVDTQDYPSLVKFEEFLGRADMFYLSKIPTPKGWHYITKPFDTREVCELPFVSLQRDGYHFIKKIGD